MHHVNGYAEFFDGFGKAVSRCSGVACRGPIPPSRGCGGPQSSGSQPLVPFSIHKSVATHPDLVNDNVVEAVLSFLSSDPPHPVAL
jgi:hypothetical protein